METWYTTTQAAERLGVSKGTVHRWLDERLLEGVYIRAGQRPTIRIAAAELERFIAEWTDDGDGSAIHRPR